MEILTKTLSLQLTLLFLILFGILAKKRGVIKTEGQKTLSDLLIFFVLPCNILSSYLHHAAPDAAFFHNCLLLVLISLLILLAAILGAPLLFRRFSPELRSIMTYGLICSNSSFVGLPIAGALYGSLGMVYGSIFQIPIRFVMWTYGLALFTHSPGGRRAWRNILLHPCILAVFAGLLLMLADIPLPAFLENGIGAVGNCTTALSMIVIGSILADAPVRSLFSAPVLYFSFLRLLAFPLFVFVCLLPFSLDHEVVRIILLMTAMPAGSTLSILADKYGMRPAEASQMLFTSTLFSIVTVPLITLL